MNTEIAVLNKWDASSFRPAVRDSQRKREYRSEWAFNDDHPGEEGMSPPKLRKFLRMVAEDWWFVERFGKIQFEIRVNHQRTRTACCSYNVFQGFTLKFPNNRLNTRLLALHELAHIVTHKQKHGPIYCGVLLQLVIHYMGGLCGRALLRQYKINGVRLC